MSDQIKKDTVNRGIFRINNLTSI